MMHAIVLWLFAVAGLQAAGLAVWGCFGVPYTIHTAGHMVGALVPVLFFVWQCAEVLWFRESGYAFGAGERVRLSIEATNFAIACAAYLWVSVLRQDLKVVRVWALEGLSVPEWLVHLPVWQCLPSGWPLLPVMANGCFVLCALGMTPFSDADFRSPVCRQHHACYATDGEGHPQSFTPLSPSECDVTDSTSSRLLCFPAYVMLDSVWYAVYLMMITYVGYAVSAGLAHLPGNPAEVIVEQGNGQRVRLRRLQDVGRCTGLLLGFFATAVAALTFLVGASDILNPDFFWTNVVGYLACLALAVRIVVHTRKMYEERSSIGTRYVYHELPPVPGI